jgi:hypothetical protein
MNANFPWLKLAKILLIALVGLKLVYCIAFTYYVQYREQLGWYNYPIKFDFSFSFLGGSGTGFELKTLSLLDRCSTA